MTGKLVQIHTETNAVSVDPESAVIKLGRLCGAGKEYRTEIARLMIVLFCFYLPVVNYFKVLMHANFLIENEGELF